MNLLNQFFWLCFFRNGPQHLPASSGLLTICAAAYVIAGTAGAASQHPWPLAAQSTLVDAVLLVLLAHGAVVARGFYRRSTQTLIALLGAGTFFSLVAIVALVVGLPPMMFWLILIWYVLVMAHILRHALEIPLMFGAGLALFYVFVSLGVTAAVTADKVV
ncbi:MAG: hypothetical protein OEZ10_00115 [Gammaproteobacteria bacterium]|nr:hypothetical protein [Gammaproteobacteria bacterium]